MKDIYAPQRDFMYNKYGKALVDGIIKKGIEDREFS